jgi:thiol-disulfide isomerase/thioredoxin
MVCRPPCRATSDTTRCGPCKVISPAFEKLAQQWTRPNTIAFAKIDHDKLTTLVKVHNVSA